MKTATATMFLSLTLTVSVWFIIPAMAAAVWAVVGYLASPADE